VRSQLVSLLGQIKRPRGLLGGFLKGPCQSSLFVSPVIWPLQGHLETLSEVCFFLLDISASVAHDSLFPLFLEKDLNPLHNWNKPILSAEMTFGLRWIYDCCWSLKPIVTSLWYLWPVIQGRCGVPLSRASSKYKKSPVLHTTVNTLDDSRPQPAHSSGLANNVQLLLLKSFTYANCIK